MAKDFPQVEVRSRAELRAWLASHHEQETSIWLVRWKAGTPHFLSYGDTVDEALCFGWIDSLPRKLDKDRTMTLPSPRKPGSGWSAVNKRKVETLIAAGLMTPAGLAKIEVAKADGSWTALDHARQAELPDDLVVALAAHPPAAENFQAFPPSTRRAILEWIGLAKRPETRVIRIETTARDAQANRRANQWRQPGP